MLIFISTVSLKCNREKQTTAKLLSLVKGQFKALNNPAPFILLNTTPDLFKTRCTAAVTRKCYKVCCYRVATCSIKIRKHMDFCFLFNTVKVGFYIFTF